MKHIAQLLGFIFFSFASYSQDYGKLLDIRDGHVYRTINVGNDVWMAENLNFQVRGSFCYDDDSENCEKYGRIYSWPLAMMGAESEAAKGVCPDGWHVSTDQEWQDLESVLKKSKNFVPASGNGFDLLFAGSRFTEGNYGFLDQCATFWTSTVDESNSKFAWTRYMYADKLYKVPARYSTNKMYGQSVRCVQDKK